MKENMNIKDDMKPCPTCDKSGYVNESFITMTMHDKEVKSLKDKYENLKNVHEHLVLKNTSAKYNFWDSNSWIFLVSIIAAVICVIALIISNHEFEPDTIGDKIKQCSQKTDQAKCVCMSGYIPEIQKDLQDSYIQSVNLCYQNIRAN